MMISVPAMIVYACWGVFAITWVIAAWFVKRTVERRWGWGRLLMILVALAPIIREL